MPHPNVFFSWQPPHGFPLEHALAGLDGLLDRLSTVHVYHWTIGSYEKNLFNDSERMPAWPDDYHRHPLADGRDRWQAYLARVRSTGREHCALLEFVRGDTVEQAQADGAELKSLAGDWSGSQQMKTALKKTIIPSTRRMEASLVVSG